MYLSCISCNLFRAVFAFSDLKEIVYGHHFLLSGGFEVDGNEISPLDEKEITHACKTLAEKGVKNIVVCGVYSPSNPSQEITVANIVKREIAGARVTMSHQVHIQTETDRQPLTLNRRLLSFRCWSVKTHRFSTRRSCPWPGERLALSPLHCMSSSCSARCS